MKAKFALIAFLLFVFYFSFAKPTLAVSVSITSFQPTITDEPFTINASISGATAGTNYLKIDLFKEGTTNYFGETYNNSDWYSGSTYSQYLPIVIQSGTTWVGSIQGRFGSPTTTDYDGPGTYKLRVRRYTSGGGYTSSEANNSVVTISINIVTPTLTPTVTPTMKPTSSPTPSITNTPTVTKTVSKTPTPTIFSFEDMVVLGNSTKSSDNGFEDPKKKNNTEISQQNNNFLPLIFITIGVVFLLACVIVFLYPKIKEYLGNKNE